jgi:hypothetical protein
MERALACKRLEDARDRLVSLGIACSLRDLLGNHSFSDLNVLALNASGKD